MTKEPGALPTKDWLGRENALRLATRIKDYWKGQANVWTIELGSHPGREGRGTYAIRSDMVNGQPQRK